MDELDRILLQDHDKLRSEAAARYDQAKAREARSREGHFQPCKYDSRPPAEQWLSSGLWHSSFRSSSVAAIHYTPGQGDGRTGGELRVQWRKSGKVSVYSNVGPSLAKTLFLAKSKGRAVALLKRYQLPHRYET
jgi:hypothetical protein